MNRKSNTGSHLRAEVKWFFEPLWSNASCATGACDAWSMENPARPAKPSSRHCTSQTSRRAVSV